MLQQLEQRDDVGEILATWHRTDPDNLRSAEAGAGARGKVRWSQLDPTDASAVAQWMDQVGELDWLINCVGFLHDEEHGPEKSIRQFDAAHFHKSMAVNCLPTLLLGTHAQAALKASTAGIFATVSARVGSIEDNRLGGWYSYRASKAALNMALKCLSIEWQRTAKRIRVAALHPGTTDTALSEPFQQNVPEGKLFSADKTAAYLIERLDELHDYQSGRFIAYDGEEIPW